MTRCIRIFTPVALLAAGLLFGACGDEDAEEFTYDSGSYFVQDYQTSYQALEKFNCTKSPTHGGDYVRVYFAEELDAAYKDATAAVPDGAVVSKAQYSDATCSTLTGVTSMRKSAAAENGWEWQRVEADGSVTFSGQKDFCVNCHKGTCGDDLLCGN